LLLVPLALACQEEKEGPAAASPTAQVEAPGETPKASPTAKRTKTPKATPTPTVEPAVGVPVKSGRYQLTVNSVTDPYTSANQFSQPDEGKRFVVIDVTIENVGEKGNISYNPLYFVLLDTNNQVYEWSFVITENDLRSGELGAGEKASGLVGFEVPVDAQIAKVKFKALLEKDIVIPVR